MLAKYLIVLIADFGPRTNQRPDKQRINQCQRQRVTEGGGGVGDWGGRAQQLLSELEMGWGSVQASATRTLHPPTG